MKTVFSDLLYAVRERNKSRKFRRMIRQGVVKSEPRFRCITTLSENFEPGSVEYAHVARYAFAAQYARGLVLNAACGSGYGNEILAKAGCSPVGVDLFDEPLETARRYFPVGEYHQGDAQELSQFADRSFDAVASFETLEHVADSTRACNAFKRVLKAGGVFVGSIPIMIFHNPGTNFTWRQARAFIDAHFPGAEIFLQTNYEINPLTDQVWRGARSQGDKYLIWTWRK